MVILCFHAFIYKLLDVQEGFSCPVAAVLTMVNNTVDAVRVSRPPPPALFFFHPFSLCSSQQLVVSFSVVVPEVHFINLESYRLFYEIGHPDIGYRSQTDRAAKCVIESILSDTNTHTFYTHTHARNVVALFQEVLGIQCRVLPGRKCVSLSRYFQFFIIMRFCLLSRFRRHRLQVQRNEERPKNNLSRMPFKGYLFVNFRTISVFLLNIQ